MRQRSQQALAPTLQDTGSQMEVDLSPGEGEGVAGISDDDDAEPLGALVVPRRAAAPPAPSLDEVPYHVGMMEHLMAQMGEMTNALMHLQSQVVQMQAASPGSVPHLPAPASPLALLPPASGSGVGDENEGEGAMGRGRERRRVSIVGAEVEGRRERSARRDPARVRHSSA